MKKQMNRQNTNRSFFLLSLLLIVTISAFAQKKKEPVNSGGTKALEKPNAKLTSQVSARPPTARLQISSTAPSFVNIDLTADATHTPVAPTRTVMDASELETAVIKITGTQGNKNVKHVQLSFKCISNSCSRYSDTLNPSTAWPNPCAGTFLKMSSAPITGGDKVELIYQLKDYINSYKCDSDLPYLLMEFDVLAVVTNMAGKTSSLPPVRIVVHLRNP